VLYRTELRWRWAIVDERGSLLDGGLRATPPDAPVEDAQAEFVRNLSEAEEAPWAADWRPGDQPDWWVAELRRDDG
jgi:hypothetical protein